MSTNLSPILSPRLESRLKYALGSARCKSGIQNDFKEIKYTKQVIHAINLVGFNPGQIISKPYYLPRQSRYCSDLKCTAKMLKYSLMEEKVGICFDCKKDHLLCQRQVGQLNSEHIKEKIIAMQCPECKKTYCLHCKISHFIVRQPGKGFICHKNIGGAQYKEQAYKFSYSPLVERIRREEDAIKNICLYREKYSYKMLHEDGITEGSLDRNAFLGLRICETCSLYVPA